MWHASCCVSAACVGPSCLASNSPPCMIEWAGCHRKSDANTMTNVCFDFPKYTLVLICKNIKTQSRTDTKPLSQENWCRCRTWKALASPKFVTICNTNCLCCNNTPQCPATFFSTYLKNFAPTCIWKKKSCSKIKIKQSFLLFWKIILQCPDDYLEWWI